MEEYTRVFVNIGKHFSKEQEFLEEKEFKELGIEIFRKEILGTEKYQFLFFKWEKKIMEGTKIIPLSDLANLLISMGGVGSLDEGLEAIRQLYGKDMLLDLFKYKHLEFTKVQNKNDVESCKISFFDTYIESPQDCGI